jgi:hypothetical protein
MEEAKCPTCHKWKTFVPFNAQGQLNECDDCYNLRHPGIVKTVKNLDENQWSWIVIQVVMTLVFLGFEQDPNAKMTPLAFVIAANFLVIFVIFAARNVWPEKK